MSSFSSALAAAIAKAEGYGTPGAIPTVANNPGDLALGDQGYGTMGAGITVFPDLSSGIAALENQVTKMTTGTSHVYTPDETLADAGNTYASGDSNWASNVASALGVPTSTTLGSLANGSSSSGVGAGILSALSNGAAGSQAATAVSAATGAQTISSALSSWSVSRVVFIILGFLFVAAGIFSFKTGQQVITEFGKGVRDGVVAG